ncbi:MAG TPA: adenylate/guanylate cyclase domain-containing protein [Baekduia sp.]|uniref:adenylate/guanylate cyclase domain-containing protein n=1 Tax=Baekduia sp. TaxID=2600305 RepID=UPI002D78DD00|nr:adenylate/guanylate cyclase domain-containing protein [Baekduia sp.]HET6507050.1 adenylate/guanylate cyclase domain-containing protein [Baekduia sp.]
MSYAARPHVTTKAIAFLDCCGFTNFTAERGDAAATRLFLALRDDVTREATPAGVEVVKWLGDGAMLAADDVTSALTCLYRTMVRTRDAAGPALPLRAGITYGPVVRVVLADTGLDYLGMSVNRAARLCAVAQPWQVRSGAEVEAVRFTLRPALV